MEPKKETISMDVIVHKANIPLMKGESISKFTQTLSEKAKDHCFTKLNMVAGKDYAWMAEAFDDSVVLSTYKGSKPNKYYAFTYGRDAKTGEFSFGSLTEVEKVIGYKPKELKITKARDMWANVL